MKLSPRAPRAAAGIRRLAALSVLSRGLRRPGAHLRDHRAARLRPAVGRGGKITNQQGALRTVEHHPFGHVLLAALAIGLGGYSLWRLLRAALGHGREGADHGLDRVGAFGSGIAYGLLCGVAVEILVGSGSSSGKGAKQTASDVFGWPGGRWLVGIAGVVMLVVAVFQFIRGVKKKFLDDAKTEQIPPAIMPAYSLFGTVGHVARAIVFGLVGVFLVKAAYNYKANEAIGLDGALAKLYNGAYRRGSSRGALGLLVFSCFSLVRSAHTGGSRIEPARPKRAPELVLGPLLRYAGSESATFWVETDAACEVEILGHRTTTFTVEGHHYALLLVDDLAPSSVIAYDVRLNGEPVWPPDDGRPGPVVHTRNHGPRVRLVFGSCRVGDPQPTQLGETWPDDVKALGIDALWTYSKQLQRGELEWPDAVLLLGDPVYADDIPPGTVELIAGWREADVEPGKQIADFEKEYTQLYRESWSEPDIRWLPRQCRRR
jgi:hypothetical protein